MKIYHYHPITKELTGEGFATLSPLDAKQGNEVYLVPACATTIEPPEAIEGKARVFDGIWKYVDILVVARQDEDIKSPSTETAFRNVEKLLQQCINGISTLNTKISENEERLSNFEVNINAIQSNKQADIKEV